MTAHEIIDEISIRLLGKPYDQADKKEFAKKYIEDFQERHKDWTEEDWYEYEYR